MSEEKEAEEVEQGEDDAQDVETGEDEEVQERGKGYKCVNCETEVELDPVDDKIICPKCSHRVLMKKRPEDPVTVEAK